MNDEVRTCLNCGATLQGHYCHACGQKDQARHLPLRRVLHDVIHDLWHLDAKLWDSVRLLALRPAFLTEEYLAGRRARHVPPFRLYIFVSFVMFLLLSTGGMKTVNFTYGGRPLAQTQLKAEAREETARSGLEAILERGATRAQADPHKAQAILLHNLPRAMFVLLPLFALLLQLAFWDRRRYFVEHMAFSLHEHTFTFLVFIAMNLLLRIPGSTGGCLSQLLFLTVPVHLGVALKRMYGVGVLRTLLSGIAVLGLYLVVVLTVLVLTVLVTLAQL